MENITHTLIGVVLGHALGRRDNPVRRGEVWTAALASNLPDIDLVLRLFSDDPKLDYLVHHRGYTHTLLAVPIAAVLAAVAGRMLDRKDPATWARLLGIGLVAGVLHITADSWNNYGVHPLSPFWDRWFYGDFIFIVEPMLWMTLLPFALFQATRRLTRGVWALLGLAMLGLVWLVPGIPKIEAVWLTALGGMLLVVQRAAQRRAVQGASQRRVAPQVDQRRVARRGMPWLVPTVATLGVLVLFGVTAGRADTRVREALSIGAPTLKPRDLVLTPAPGNPLCWNVIALTIEDGAVSERGATGGNPEATAPNSAPAGTGPRYVALIGDLSLAPGLVPPDQCAPLRSDGPRTAPLVPAGLPDTPDLHWRARFEAPLGELACLEREDCRAAAALTFIRAPFWLARDGEVVLGDLRYDFEAELGFAEFALPRASTSRHCTPGDPPAGGCPSAPWIPPFSATLEAAPSPVSPTTR